MNAAAISCSMIPFVLSSALSLAGQFLPEEVARRSDWEDFLRTAKIISAENIGEGVTKPKKLLLRKGEVEAWAIWKRPGGTDAGRFDKWECEIAAYRMDRLLALGMVPPTVERRYKMYAGSLQLWADLPISEKKIANESIPIPSERLDEYRRIRAIQRAFDSLIGNSDRSLQNLCYTRDWRMILIDHSRAFGDSNFFGDKLVYGKNGVRGQQEFWPLPRVFVERVRALTYEMIREAVEDYLTSWEIKAVLTRQKLFLQEIDELTKEKGEAAVLY